MHFQYQLDVQGYSSYWSEDRVDHQLATVWSFTHGSIHLLICTTYKVFELVWDEIGEVYVAPLEAIEWLKSQEVRFQFN